MVAARQAALDLAGRRTPAPDPPPRPSDMLKLPSQADKDKLKAFL